MFAVLAAHGQSQEGPANHAGRSWELRQATPKMFATVLHVPLIGFLGALVESAKSL
jgi:hypothetical protein